MGVYEIEDFYDVTAKRTANFERHGLTKTNEYRSWSAAKARCFNTNHHKYAHYGARGITMCEEWAQSFSSFLRDMGYRPSPSHSLDRIDNDGNYEPSNCRWATQNTQASNKRQGLPRSGFTGVYRCEAKGKRVWVYEVILEGKRHRSRRYDTPEQAAIARDLFLLNNYVDAPLLLNKLLSDGV